MTRGGVCFINCDWLLVYVLMLSSPLGFHQPCKSHNKAFMGRDTLFCNASCIHWHAAVHEQLGLGSCWQRKWALNFVECSCCTLLCHQPVRGLQLALLSTCDCCRDALAGGAEAGRTPSNRCCMLL